MCFLNAALSLVVLLFFLTNLGYLCDFLYWNACKNEMMAFFVFFASSLVHFPSEHRLSRVVTYVTLLADLIFILSLGLGYVIESLR